jgi:predicted CoA-binding protein
LVENVDAFIAITDLEGSKTVILASNSKNVWLWTKYGREDLFQEFYSEDIANKNKTNNTPTVIQNSCMAREHQLKP